MIQRDIVKYLDKKLQLIQIFTYVIFLIRMTFERYYGM